MPACCVIQCGARRNKNQPALTLHRFPVNEIFKKKWIEVIGQENINPRHKILYVCSMHFDESSFNRTLNVIRLCDGAVPLPSLLSNQVCSNYEQQNPEAINPRAATSSSAMPLAVNNQQNQIKTTLNSQHSASAKIRQQNKKIKHLSEKCTLLKRKVRSLNERVRRRDKKIAHFCNIIEELQKRKFINNEECIILEECAGPKDFLKRQIAKSKGLPLEKKYNEEIRKFALTLHFYSAKAYNFIRNTYNTCLPHPRTLSKWYQNINAEPGFTKEAFEALKRKVSESIHPVICALTLDEMSIRKCLTWDPKAMKFYGRVDCGQDVDSDSLDEASQCLVLLLNALNGTWKLPIGYFLIVSLSGEQKTTLVQTAVQLCQDAGVKVVSVTCDGLAGNFSMFTSLGCNVLKDQTLTNFKENESPIQVFIDPCHAIKLVRNAFGELRIFTTQWGEKLISNIWSSF